MDCAGCGRANRPGAKFCGGCGRPLAPRCPACGNECQPGAQFCDACGAALAVAKTPAAEARKVVTIVFADLIGSTALHERLDAESARRLMDRYHRSMGAVVESHGGTVMQLLGDGVLAGFGVPRVAEDDALRAVHAAVGMQQAFRALAEEQAERAGRLGLRVAVYTGEVVAGDDHTHVMGDPVNVAARLQQEARDGDVLLGESTRRLVADKVTLAAFGSFALKGRAEPVAAWRVVSLERPAGAAAIGFVGREDELRRIQAVYDGAVAARAARLAVVLGSPGLGKSRLIDEFTRRLGDGATVLLAHCNAAGGATFAPLADALRGLLRIDTGAAGDTLRQAILLALPGEGPERDRIADGIAALVAGTPASPEEIFFVVRRGLATLAGVRPVVLAIDDIQWAEPLLLDLVEHLVQWGSDAPLLVLVAARPELRDARSSLATPGGLVSEVVTLAGLDAGAATRLAANAIGAAELPAAIAGRILATSEGNPLFVGELVRMLVHDGALRREGDRWTTAVALEGLEMPPTIHALLAARIERLRPEERTVLERAAVIGRRFSRTSLAQLLPREITDLDARLESLRRSELVEPDTGWFLGEPMLRFHHVLIRDAAYRRLLKNTRAELHGRFADWLEARAGDAVEHDETLGWHLEQAHQHLRELGPVDAQGRALGERAVRVLAAAGRRALARDDLTPAANLLERALARLDPDDPARADLALDWCEALLSAGDVANATRGIAELGRFTAASDRLRAWHTCFSGQLAVFTDPKALRASADAVEAAAAALASAGDAAGEAKAHSVHALVLAQLGKIGACEAALDKALAAARRAGDRRRANAVLAGAPVAALWGPGPVTRASGRCLDVVRVLRITQGAPAVEAVALRCQAVLETLRGRAEAARRMITSSRRMVEELGITQRVLEADLFAGLIELLEGDAAAAERWLRTAYDGLRAQGLGIDAAQAAALLGRALLAQGRVEEAEAISLESESLAGDSFKAAIAWRGVRAEALAVRGEHPAAIEFARAAVEIAAATDDLLDHADARQALAIALHAAGRRAEADAETKRATELWEAKGATLLAERARRLETRSVESSRFSRPSSVPAQTTLHRVCPNAATAVMARSAAAIEARDAEAIAVLHGEAAEYVDHTTGASYGREGFLASLRSMTSARDLTFRQEPLAVLGDSLVLARRISSASGVSGGAFDIGPLERIALNVIELDEQLLIRRIETFPTDRLGDAVVRLYERHAELLPDGPERTRAAATARSIAGLMGPVDPGRWATALAPTIEFTDRRSVGLLGFGRGADAVLRGMHSILEVADGLTNRIDDVLGLRSDAFLQRWTNFGTARASGGAFERQYLQLFVFGSDGLATRMEWFDSDRDAEALARFESTSEAPRPERRVRPNAATLVMERYAAAFAAKDARALAALFADDFESVEHQTGAAMGREEALGSLQAMLRSSSPSLRYEPLAALGDSLGLVRRWWSSEATRGKHFDVAASETEEIAVYEVDPGGCFRRGDIYSPEHLGDAIACLYERYAELLPEGAERERAAATARSAAALSGPTDEEHLRVALSPEVESVDWRIAGLEPQRGIDAFLRAFGTLRQLSQSFSSRIDDVLDLRSDGLLLRLAVVGIDRTSGGEFERPFLCLLTVGADGRVSRWELFDLARAAEALARFEQLISRTAGAPRRVRLNAATANAAGLDAAIAAKDADALPGLFADSFALEDHQTGVAYDRAGSLGTWRGMLRMELRYRQEPLATLGDSLALLRQSSSGVFGGKYDAGAYDREELVLLEVDAQGRRRRAEIFASNHLGDAIARLFERSAELLPDGPARTRAAATARSVAVLLGPFDPDRYAVTYAPTIEVVDRRTLGTMTARGAEAHRQGLRSWSLLSDNTANRFEEILELRSGAFVGRLTFLGTERAGGGVFERPFILLYVFGSDGLLSRLEYFDAGRDAEVLARFDELTAGPPKSERRVRPNAATANVARVDAAIAARDEQALPTVFAEGSEGVDHTTETTWDYQGMLATWRALLRSREPKARHEPLATLGDSLALCRVSTSASGFSGRTFDVGAYEREEAVLIEVDAQGRRRRTEGFAADRLGDAIARFYQRYAELLPESAARVRAAATGRSLKALLGPFELARLAPALAPSIEFVDHRVAGMEPARGAEAYLGMLRALLEVADGVVTRVDDVIGLRSEALMIRWTNSGNLREGGGAYERRFIRLFVFDTAGLLARSEFFELDGETEALARFDELTGGSRVPSFANASARVMHRFLRCWRERNWDGMVATLVPAHRVDDRRRLFRLAMSAEQSLASLRFAFELPGSQMHAELLATRGEQLALFRIRISGQAPDSGLNEVEHLQLMELDASGRHSAIVAFDLGDLAAAHAELDARFEALSQETPAASHIENAATRAEDAVQRAWNSRDWEAFKALIPADFRSIDRRPLMQLETDRETLLAGIRPFHDSRVERSSDLLATRGERLALFRMRLRGSVGGSGPSEVELLQVIDVGADGLRSAAVAFAPEDLDAAHAELDNRFRAGEAAPHVSMWDATVRFSRALSARDWQAASAALSEDFVFEDHRRFGFGNPSRDEFIIQIRAMVDLSPDVAQRVDHTLAVHDRGLLAIGGWVGTRDGGAFEIPSATVMEVGPDRRIRRIQAWDVDQLAAARARFAALVGTRQVHPIENAATRQAERVTQAWNAHDWQKLTALYPAGFRSHDRSRKTQIGELDRAQHLEWMRPLFEMASSRFAQEILATRGNRLALLRLRVEVAGESVGPSEIESLAVTEVDERGERSAMIRFHPGDQDAAYAELDARHAAGEAAPCASITAGMQEFKRAFSQRDWKALEARCAPDLVVHDRRLLGWETLHGPKAYVEALRQLVDLAPDTKLRIDHTDICAAGYLVVTVWEGSHHGGPYEAPSLMVAELDGQGRIRRFDQYDLERLEEARARLAELRPDPLHIPPNAATRASDRNQALLHARDWDGLARLVAPTMVFDDRRRGIRVTGDRDTYLATTRIVANALRMSRTLLATLGDRLALNRGLWEGEVDGAAIETELLSLMEVDTDGRIVAIVAFDADDRRGASREMSDRYFRGEGARSFSPSGREAFRALNDHDLVRLRAALPDEFCFHDHRRTGLGRIGNADDYVASVEAMLEQSRDLTAETLYIIAADEHGSLNLGRMFGSLVDGGEFESVFLRLGVYRDGRFVGLELFEIEDLDRARARFAELRSDPLRIPPNDVTRAMDRAAQRIEAGDWKGLTDLFSPAFRFEDRRRMFRDSGDRDQLVASIRLAASHGFRTLVATLATAGERLALLHFRFQKFEDSALIAEVENLQLFEVDAEGRFVASIVFDSDDRSAASLEMTERQVRVP
jgi:class 3 adenylate cyclase/ketosteroid isomerase-like protein